MAIDPEITRNVEQVRNATYGKDVREAIARGLELCYGYTSGETADEAAQRANTAAERVEGLIDDSEQAVHDVQQALEDVDDIVKVSTDQPTETTNKIWIQPQDNTEYKVATFAAYEVLWSRMNEINETYEQGHGGIVSIALDSNYLDPTDSYKKRYIITYSDETTGEFFVNNGRTGEQGPIDTITGTTIYYHKGVTSGGQLITTPPTTGWSTNIPDMSAGDYLWTQTVLTYASTAEAYIYGLTRWGLNGRNGIDGTGAVNAVALGVDGEDLPNTDGTVHIPLDQAPSVGSGSLLTSGAVYTALSTLNQTIESLAPLASPVFTGTPQTVTAETSDDSTRIASTAFVHDLFDETQPRQISVTMRDSDLEYLDASITEDTYCLFAGINPSDLPSSLSWATSTGKLNLYLTKAPASTLTFTVVLVDTLAAQ